MKGLERVCGPRPAEKGAKEDRRGTAGSDPRTADRMGSGLRGPRPAEEATAETFVLNGLEVAYKVGYNLQKLSYNRH